MKTIDKQKEIIFFAYQGKKKGTADSNVEAIKEGIKSYNQFQGHYIAKSWEEYKTTSFISKDILTAISNCSVFAADLTSFNDNVLFELGYAIARRRKILIFLDERKKEVSQKYKNFILRDLQWQPIKDHNDVHAALQNHYFENDLIGQIEGLEKITESIDIFYKTCAVQDQFSMYLTAKIMEFKDNNFSVINDDGSEVKYRTLDWYFLNIFKSKNIVMHFMNPNYENSEKENSINSFYAGVACGRDKNVLLLAPAKFTAPLDYHEILVQYQDSSELISTVNDWLISKLKRPELNPSKDGVPETEDLELNLLKMGIGCDVAEDEKDKLLDYFIPTASYERAKTQAKSLIVGLKGTGKSAIYIKLQNDFTEKNTYLIGLKPESDDLIEDIQKSQLYNSTSKSTFFSYVWRALIFSKILQSLNDQIQAKPSFAGYTNEEKSISEFYREHEITIGKNFYGIAKEFCGNSSGPEFLEELNINYISKLSRIIKKYFSSIDTKYLKIIIMADNLDKTWNFRNNLDVQADMLKTLIDIENRISNELVDKKMNKIEVKQIVFLRKDIYEYIYKREDEKDKLRGMVYEIDWDQYPNLLSDLIESRFKSILNLKTPKEVKEIWKQYFDFNDKDPFSVIKAIIEKRPRDIIYFVMNLFAAAFNGGKTKVGIEELKSATIVYEDYLKGYLVTEISAEYPWIEDLISKVDELGEQPFFHSKLLKVINSFKKSKTENDSIIKILSLKNYLAVFDDNNNLSTSFKDYLALKTKKRFLLFNKDFLLLSNYRKKIVQKNLENIGLII